MDSAFVKLSTPGRALGYLGLRMDPGVTYTSHRKYQYVELPARPVLTAKGNPRRVVRAGEQVVLESAGTINPSKCNADVVVNEQLLTLGYCQHQARHEEDYSGTVRVVFVPFEDIDLNAALAAFWLVRIYAIC